MDNINCITLNVRGLRNKNKRDSVFEFLKSKKIHIVPKTMKMFSKLIGIVKSFILIHHLITAEQYVY